MSTETKHRLGERVIGKEAAARQAAEDEKAGGNGGQHVLGDRVVGALETAVHPQAIARQAMKPGFMIETDVGTTNELSVDDIQNMLDENPTVFDSLYVGELRRPGGPRKAALQVFGVVESGIKGEGRLFILNEINELLGVNATSDQSVKAEIEAKRKAFEAQQQRTKINAQLPEAEKAAKVAEMKENLRGAGIDADLTSHTEPADVDKQVANRLDKSDSAKKADDDSGTSGTEGESSEGGRVHKDLGKTDVKPETQQRTRRSSQKKKK